MPWWHSHVKQIPIDKQLANLFQLLNGAFVTGPAIVELPSFLDIHPRHLGFVALDQHLAVMSAVLGRLEAERTVAPD
jgi:hypothetical protein